MFGELAIAYLFLGGAGAGCLAVCSLVDLFVVREPFGWARAARGLATCPIGQVQAFGFAVGYGALAVGVACLLLDIGRIDRALGLFAPAQPTVVGFGAFVLVALLLTAALPVLARFLYVPQVPRAAVTATEVATVVVGVVAATYTGVLLAGLGGVRFWVSPLLPVLFLLSSLSCGVAVPLAGMAFVGDDADMRVLRRRLCAADCTLVLAEVAVAAAFWLIATQSDHPGVQASVALLRGSAPVALAWWWGFGLCGLAVPLALEAAVAVAGRMRAPTASARTAVAVAAACVLVGAACLRWAVVDAGTHRALELQDVPQNASLALSQSANQNERK